jgi:hypothetical protein
MNTKIVNTNPTKVCSKCQEKKPLSEFHTRKNCKDGHRNECKICRRQYAVEYGILYNKKYNFEHKDERHQWYLENKEDVFIYNNKSRKQKYATDIIFKTSCQCRNMVRNALNGQPKKAHTMDYFMCSQQFFMDYIESLWLPGMTWNNRGNGPGKWNIDHIIPISFFIMTDEVEKYMCCQYQNLQPLWWEDNMAKSGKY